MGLDIYFKRVKHARMRKENESTGDYIMYLSDQYEKENTEYKEKLQEYIKKWISKKNTCNITNLHRLMKSHFDYEYEIEPLMSAKTKEDVQKWYDHIEWDLYRMPYAAYFRKVNCIFRYFEDKLIDESICLVEKAEIADFVERADKVLRAQNEDTSRELLPTRSGFFFGSTDYDSWYYSSIERAKKLFSKMLKDWEDSDVVFVYMSW